MNEPMGYDTDDPYAEALIDTERDYLLGRPLPHPYNYNFTKARPMQDTIQRVNVNPSELLVDVNIRHDTRIDKDFLASIKEHGVIVPITAVRTSPGELRVRHGHRRTHAAVAGELQSVPVDVVGD